MGKRKDKQKFIFKYVDGSKPDVTIVATSKGKAWNIFRRQHEAHAKKKDYKISRG